MSSVDAVQGVSGADDEQVAKAKRALQDIPSGTPVLEAANSLIRTGLSEQAVREAITDALYEGGWTLTSDRRLERA